MNRLMSGIIPLHRLRNDMDRLFDRVFDDCGRATTGMISSTAFPALNVWENADNVYAEAELAGVRIDTVDVSVVGNELTIKGTRKDETKEGTVYHRRERGVGTFSRTLHLPVDVDAERVQATMRQGVLLVTLPKTAAAKPRKVKVQSLPE